LQRQQLHSCSQRKYLGSYKTSTIKSTHSIYSGMLLIEIRESKIILIGSHGPLDSHVTVFFLTNESALRGSRAVKSRKLRYILPRLR